MILAAGLTPAWQQILQFDALQPGEVNRAAQAQWCASGKVINAGVALHHLGAESLTLCVRGGLPGEALSRDFQAMAVPARWITTKRNTRVCTTLLESDGRTTELVENAGPLEPAELDAFLEAYREEAPRAAAVVLSGSLPQGTPSSLYASMLATTRCPAVLDIRGEELDLALPHRPLVIKPNREELAKTVRRPLDTEADLIAAMHEMNLRGAAWVVVSQGGDDLLATSAGTVRRFTPPRVRVVNPIGCGDCLAAGIAAGVARGDSMIDAIRLGMGAAAENATQLLSARLDVRRTLDFAARVPPV